MIAHRRTLSGAAHVQGIGLHTGSETRITFRPAAPGHGVVFTRTDLADHPRVPASLEYVTDVERRTSLGNGEGVVQTVEHVLAAVAAHQLDDVQIDLDGPEPPVADGSAEPFFAALTQATPAESDGAATIYRIQQPFVVRENDSMYVVSPNDKLRLTVTIEWDHPLIGRQSGCYDITPDDFASSLARARTFGFESEAKELKAKGLAKGASKDNVIVLSETDVVGTKLRWSDEFVRHKAVDLLGDLLLLEGRIEADIVAFHPSHRGNVALARAIQRTASNHVPAVMGIQEILGALPHRYPMLLVDRIIAIEPGKRIVGLKNVTINEPFFQGHFPDHPIMPGVLIVEAMAQVGGLLLMGAFDNPQDKVVYFMAIDKVRFRKPVLPGDQLRFELEMLHFRGRNCRMRGIGYVQGQPVAEAEMMARVVDK